MSALEALFADHCTRFAQFIGTIDAYADALVRIGPDHPPEPRWDQVWFPRLDACAAYTMVRSAVPARIVEIGAGHSTRFMARAIRDGGLGSHLTVIDPSPRATIDGLPIDWIAEPVQRVEMPTLAEGDILFVDSSHVAGPGSDVAHVLHDTLPALPSGTLVHFHDIFLPDPYPAEWANRRYSEQEAVAGLLGGGGYEPVFASRYVVTRMGDIVAGSIVGRLPLMTGAFENSLWLRKIGAAA